MIMRRHSIQWTNQSSKYSSSGELFESTAHSLIEYIQFSKPKHLKNYENPGFLPQTSNTLLSTHQTAPSLSLFGGVGYGILLSHPLSLPILMPMPILTSTPSSFSILVVVPAVLKNSVRRSRTTSSLNASISYPLINSSSKGRYLLPA